LRLSIKAQKYIGYLFNSLPSLSFLTSSRNQLTQNRMDPDQFPMIGTTVEEDNLPRFGFSFSPGGLLFPYQIGIAKYLLEAGLITEDTPLCGASAGALCAVALGAGLDIDVLFAACGDLMAELRPKGARHHIWHALRRQLETFLPEDVHEVLNRRPGGVGVAVTFLVGGYLPYPRGEVIFHWRSKADVIEVLMASCNVPMWTTWTPLVRCRGRPAMDGFFGQPKGCFGAAALHPHRARHTVRVLPGPQADVDVRCTIPGDVISPSVDPSFTQTFKDLLQDALNPYGQERLEELYAQGQRDGARWHAHGDFGRLCARVPEEVMMHSSHKAAVSSSALGEKETRGEEKSTIALVDNQDAPFM